MSKHATREQWLNAAVELLRPIFKTRAKIDLPKKIRISCGFPMGRGKAIGQCWSKTASGDGTFEIFVSPKLDEEMQVLDVTVHELVHAGVGLDKKHGPIFKAGATAMLLEGKMKATTGGDAFKKEIGRPVLKALGEYPHAELTGGLSSGPGKQDTRLMKVFCAACDYKARITRKWIEVGVPTCPNEECSSCGEEMQVA